jgi:CheY-like chemotaxis protein
MTTEETTVKVLCVEDESKWQRRVQDACNHTGGVEVDFVEAFDDVKARITDGEYDVVTLDSRLKPNIKLSRMHQLIDLVRQSMGGNIPVIALTAYDDDLSNSDRQRLFQVFEKEDVYNSPDVLKRGIVDALGASLISQAECLLGGARRQLPVVEPGEVFERIAALADVDAGGVAEKARQLLAKRWICQRHEANCRVQLLDCLGYVSAINDDQVEVVLDIVGQNARRVFDSARFIAADLYYEDAPFRYIVTREGAEVSSRIDQVSDSCLEDMRRRRRTEDLSMFEGFDLGGSE